jgi:hypothetical protein
MLGSLDNPNASPEDKHEIRILLKKPWNPYIRRHSALTEKSALLKEHHLRQFAGWSPGSNMHLKYLHFFGNESNKSLLEAYGIVSKDQKLPDSLRPKLCPNCNEPNKPDSNPDDNRYSVLEERQRSGLRLEALVVTTLARRDIVYRSHHDNSI